MHSVLCRVPPRELTWHNVLKTDQGAALAVESSESSAGVNFVLEQATLRQSGSLLSCAGPLAEQASTELIEVEARNCVLDVAKGFPLVELIGPKFRPDWSQAIRLMGDGCLVPPSITLLASTDLSDGNTSPLESDDLQFEGLFTDEYTFAGRLSDNPRDSLIEGTQAPRRPDDPLPGISPERLAD
jgi:hypothetical protein